jgi:ribonuclease I
MLVVGAASVDARGHHHRHERSNAEDEASATGQFDYYLLSLSWSPQHCAERTGPLNDPQCATTRHYNFIVHGLWPQYESGGFPESCAGTTRPSEDVIAATVLPDRSRGVPPTHDSRAVPQSR